MAHLTFTGSKENEFFAFCILNAIFPLISLIKELYYSNITSLVPLFIPRQLFIVIFPLFSLRQTLDYRLELRGG